MCIRDSLRKFKGLEKKKKAHLLCSLAFLLRCWITRVIPRFLNLKNTTFTLQPGRIYRRAEQATLRECIHQTGKYLARYDQNLLELYLRLSGVLSLGHWDLVDGLTISAFALWLWLWWRPFARASELDTSAVLERLS